MRAIVPEVDIHPWAQVQVVGDSAGEGRFHQVFAAKKSCDENMKKGDSFFLAAIVETKVCEDISRCSGVFSVIFQWWILKTALEYLSFASFLQSFSCVECLCAPTMTLWTCPWSIWQTHIVQVRLRRNRLLSHTNTINTTYVVLHLGWFNSENNKISIINNKIDRLNYVCI